MGRVLKNWARADLLESWKSSSCRAWASMGLNFLLQFSRPFSKSPARALKNGQAREKPEPGLGSDQSLIFCEYLWVIDKKIGSICWHQSARGRTDRIVSRSVDLVYPAKGNGKNSRKQIETSASAMHCKSEQWTHTSSVLILQSVAKKIIIITAG